MANRIIAMVSGIGPRPSQEFIPRLRDYPAYPLAFAFFLSVPTPIPITPPQVLPSWIPILVLPQTPKPSIRGSHWDGNTALSCDFDQ